MLLEFLSLHDAPCPACGYNLHKLTQPTCPECGLALKLSVGSDTPFKRAWAITLGLNAMIAGVGLVFILFTFASGPPPLSNPADYVWYVGPMLWIPVPVLVYALRRQFCALRNAMQHTAIVLTLVWMLILGTTILANF